MHAPVPLLGLDLGEHPDEPAALWDWIDVAHIACGGHAGDDASMRAAAGAAAARGLHLFAHPSYPDRAGFGRRTLALPAAALRDSLGSQLAALAAAAAPAVVSGVKPHGALYHDADADETLALLLVDAATDAGLDPGVLVGPAVPASGGGALARVAAARGWVHWAEAFADRGVDAAGALLPRGTPGALLDDPGAVAARARALAGTVPLLGLHADRPGALARVEAAARALGRGPRG